MNEIIRFKIYLSSNYKMATYYGLAMCHTKEHSKIEHRLPAFQQIPVQWTYLDTKAIPSEDQIQGNLYDPEVLKRAAQLHPEGYDYVVMIGCGIGGAYIKRYRLIAPLIGVGELLKEGGHCLHTNFIGFAIRLIDPRLIHLNQVLDQSREEWTRLMDQLNIEMGRRDGGAIDVWVRQQFENPEFRTHILEPFCNQVAAISEFRSFQIVSFDMIIFTK